MVALHNSIRAFFPRLHYARCSILAWLILCQFPLPMAHSHEAMAALHHPSLAGHLQTHHRTDADPQELHWHWLMPWDFSHGEWQGDVPRLAASALGLWGADGAGLLGASNGSWNTLSPQGLGVGEATSLCLRSAMVVGGRGTAPRSTSPASFMQTYLGVRLAHLVGVDLR